MKGCGITLLVFAVSNFIVLLFSLGSAPQSFIAQTASAVGMFAVLGLFLISRAKKKKEEEERKKKWDSK